MFRLLSLGLAILLIGPSLAGAEQPQKALTVLDFRQELGLNPDQVSRIRNSLASLRTQMRECQNQRSALQKDLNQLLLDSAPLPTIRTRLEGIATQQVESQMADIATARTIREILSADQFKHWQDVQSKH